MRSLRAALTEHRHFALVVTLLTLAMTFPTVAHVFRTDLFWLPTGESYDVYIKIWDVWYVKQILTGQADRFYTDMMFYPEGLSLVFHPLFFPFAIVANCLHALMPLSNAYSLTFLLLIAFSAFTAYIYILWLFKDKWIALFAAAMFGLSPHIVGHPNHPDTAFAALLPLTVYCAHRGIVEKRLILVVIAGLLTGLSSLSILYVYICTALTLGLLLCAFAASNWRSRRFWIQAGALISAALATSLWRIIPLIADSRALDEALAWYGNRETFIDIISFLINSSHPLLGPTARSVFQTPEGAAISPSVYIGLLPLSLIAIALIHNATRRQALLWAALAAVFFFLTLGSFLSANGVVYREIRLLKFYLDSLIPSVFRSFDQTDSFHIGLLLPLTVMSCYGIAAANAWLPRLPRRRLVLICIAIVAFEYYIPVQENVIPREQFDYLDWLADEEASGQIRLINLPMGRKSSKRYNLYQALSGYPQAEGAISRTPESAFDYIRANPILGAWNDKRPIACNVDARETYLLALDQLEADDFSHVVFHQNVGNPLTIVDSFRNARPSYRDDYASIYRLDDLRESCPG